MKDLVWFIYGERQGYKGQVLWAVARLLHRPSDAAYDASSLVKH